MEKDTFGELRVDASRYWGAQTQRSLMYFDIGEREKEKIPTRKFLFFSVEWPGARLLLYFNGPSFNDSCVHA